MGLSLQSKKITLTIPKKAALVCLLIVIAVGTFYSGRAIKSDYWYYKGMKAIAQTNLDRGEIHLRKALILNPQNSEAYLAMGHIWFLRKNKEKIKAPLEKSITLFKSMNTMKISAHTFYYSEMYDEAEIVYLNIIEYFPFHLTSLAKLAQMYFIKKQYEKAHEFASRLLDCEPRVKNGSDYRNKVIASEIINITGPLLYSVE